MDGILWVLGVSLFGIGLYTCLRGEYIAGSVLILLSVLVGPGGAALVGPPSSGVAQEPVQNPYTEFQGIDGHTLIYPMEQR